MKILHVQQGTIEWHDARAKHFTASEAPAMMGLSKYTTRAELLKQKATGIAKEIDAATQRRFNAGHSAEAMTRPLAEARFGESLFPVTGTLEVDGLPLLASFDGLTMDDSRGWENKLWNAEFAAYVLENNDAPETHWPQLEQQLLISGAEYILFSVSDGTEENSVWLEYRSRPERRAQLIAGWKQFAKDLADYTPVEVIPAAVAAPQFQLPAVTVQVMGGIEVRDNLAAFGEALTMYVERINHSPQSDQDFADLDGAVKTLKAAEEALTAAENSALGQAGSLDLLRRTVNQLRELARTNRLQAEKTVKAEKENRRSAIIFNGKTAFESHIADLNKRLGGKLYMPIMVCDFAGVVKGLKTITSIQNAVDTELARAKIESSAVADRIEINLNTLREMAKDHAVLFSDAAQLVLKPNEDLIATIKTRIAEYKAAEEKRLEEERAKIRQEEEAKARAAVAAQTEAVIPAPAVAAAPAAAPTLAEVLHTVAPAAVAEAISPRTMKLGEISAALGFAVTSEFLAGIGYPVVATDKNAKLYRACDFPAMCRAISAHVLAVAAAQQQKAA